MKGRNPDADGIRRSNGIFISYRRGDSDGQAHALRARLTAEYGRTNVFMDVDSIVPGTDFVHVIESELAGTEVMLVLIGADWQGGHGGRGRLSDPGDFVRLEVTAALYRRIPIIPVLVESATLPRAYELPEPLRPLIRRQAVNLRSASWDYDISRVTSAVARYVKPARRSRRGLLALAAVAAVIVAAVTVLLWLIRPAPPVRQTPTAHQSQEARRSPQVASLLTAAAPVGAEQPDRLIEKLLNTPFAESDVPNGASPAAPELSDALTSLTSGKNGAAASGLVATITVPFSSHDDIAVNYYIFRDNSSANSYFAGIVPYPDGYTSAAPFGHPVIRDSTKCQRATEVGQGTVWGCVTLSAYVVSYSTVIQPDQGGSYQGNGGSIETALASDTVRHLKDTATMQPQTALPQPPGPSLNPLGLYGQAQSPFPDALTPSGLSQPKTTTSAETPNPQGLEGGHYIQIEFSGSGQYYSSGTSKIGIEIFDNVQDARSRYDKIRGLLELGAMFTQTVNEPYSPSGFSATQQAQCLTSAASAESGSPASGHSTCFVQWGDVVVIADTADYATQANPQPKSADSDMAITLATSGLLFVGQLVAA